MNQEAETTQSQGDDLPDRVDDVLEALWEGKTGELDRLADLDDRRTSRISEPIAGRLRGPLPAAPALPPGSEIGNYTVKEVIGHGGMGTVYLALQARPRRTVALKVMNRGIASPTVLRRFEFESQILARLRHPNIAQVFEAGTHDGRDGPTPYFAMEYVPNAKPITDYLNIKRLGIRDRLELFRKVCAAVHHGHLKGIIHRDLKPGNILVDSSGEPKIIDFGVARSTDSDMAVTTLQTDIGQLVGTLRYMSPEQCEADPHNLDVRSDVYALGVVLYEMLCGRLPYTIDGLPIHEAARVIREQAPVKPRAVNGELHAHVETIVLKALEKDRRRRYGAARQLGEDVDRYLHDRPILARQPSFRFRLQVFVRKHTAAVIAGVFLLVLVVLAAVGGLLAVVIALSLGLLATAWQYVQTARAKAEATRQRDIAIATHRAADIERARASSAENLANERRLEAEQAQHDAELAAVTAGAINEFLVQDMLASADPRKTSGREITVREALDNAARKVDAAFRDQPEVRAALHRTIGMAYWNLGRDPDAERHLRSALEIHEGAQPSSNREIADVLNSLGRVLYEQGDLRGAEPVYRKALELRQKIFGADHPQVAVVLTNLASLMRSADRLEEAEDLYRKALAIYRLAYGPEHRTVAANLTKLAKLLEARRDYSDAEALFREAVQMQERLLGTEHLDLAFTLNNLANLLQRTGDHDGAEPCLRRALTIFRARLGDRHHTVLVALNNLANLLRARGELDAATQVFHDALEVAGAIPVRGDAAAVLLRIKYGSCLIELGRLDEAETQLLAARKALQEATHPDQGKIDAVNRKLADLRQARASAGADDDEHSRPAEGGLRQPNRGN